MDIYRDDLLKNKYFLGVMGIIALIAGVIYIINYNSLENRCTRKIQSVGSYFGTRNKLQEMALNSAMEKEIQKCIKSGKL